MTFTQFVVPALAHPLAALSGWLDKAEAHAAEHGGDPADYLALRLAPDMWPLASQIRIAAFQAQEPLWRLRGEPAPDALVAVRSEGAAAAADPGSWASARARLAEAIIVLGEVAPGSLDAAADAPLAHSLPMGMVFDMTGWTYVRDWALPQVGFHQMAAYAILRQAGVPLGKTDFIPHMFEYLRPGTMPGR